MEFDSHIIQITDDEKIDEECIAFFKQLEEDYRKFKKELNYYEQNFNKIKNAYDQNKSNSTEITKFEPENVKIKSPLTIIHSPWGIGKTFFIENVCKLIMKGKIKPIEIKKIIPLDALHFAACNDIPNTLIIETLYKLLETVDSKKKKQFKKIFKEIVNSTFVSWINKALKTNLKGFNTNNIKKQENYIKELDQFISSPTLLIIDNIERLGEHAWDIIRTTQKLSTLKNLIFLLPMNKDMLFNNIPQWENESAIQKYLTIPMYVLEQDYSSVLKKSNVNEKYINLINNILKRSVHITNRELKNILFKHKSLIVSFNKCKYKGLKEMLEIFHNHPELKRQIESSINEDVANFERNEIKYFIEQNDKLNSVFDSSNFIIRVQSLLEDKGFLLTQEEKQHIIQWKNGDRGISKMYYFVQQNKELNNLFDRFEKINNKTENYLGEFLSGAKKIIDNINERKKTNPKWQWLKNHFQWLRGYR